MEKSAEFNTNNRTSNSIKTSFWGGLKSVLDIILGFIYRTIFISALSSDHLGLNGLFTNILQVLSLAELGITTAIVFRFYKPISQQNYTQVGKLMNYLKKVYKYIALFILGAGLIIAPFIKLYGVKKICKNIDDLAQTYSFESYDKTADFISAKSSIL